MNLPKKIICLSLIVTLICNPVVTYAQAGTLTVSGGSTVGGISVATTLCMMVARSLGFTFHLAQTAVDAGQSVSDWLEGEMNDWLKNLDATEIEMMTGGGSGGNNNGNDNNDGNKVGPDGKVYIGAGALYMIQKFFNWLKSRGIIKNGVVSAPTSDYQVNGTWYGAPCGPWKWTTSPASAGSFLQYANYGQPSSSGLSFGVVALPVNGGYYAVIYVPANAPGRVTAYAYYGSPTYFVGSGAIGNRYVNSHGIEWAYTVESFRKGIPDIVPYGVKVIPTTGDIQQSVKNYLDTLTGFTPGAWGDISDETYIEGDYSSTDLDNSNGYYMEIDPNILEGLRNQMAENTNATISVQEYLKAIQNSLNQQTGTQPESVNARDNETLDNLPLTVPEPEPYTPVLPSDQVDPESTVDPPEESTPVSVPPETAPPSETIPLMLFPLKDYFPFCIPWDIYDIFSKFIGDPVAPNFTVTLPNPGDNSNVQVEIDLAMFDDMMVIIRKAELMAFVVGLAIATKDIYAK